MEQVVPTEPGWWWAKEVGQPEPDDVVVEVRDDEGWGLRAWDGGLPYTLTSFHWLAPVAEHEEVERLRAEVERLTGWLSRIDGGDAPCDDPEQIRRWAYEALTLGRGMPE